MSGPTVLSIDWENLPPRERTVLCFLVVGGDLLLIRKKTGLGRGMFNVPGGRIEPGEDPLDAAVRETREETGLTPRGLVPAGNLLFYFAEGFLHTCRVFSAGAFEGTAVRTREADPLWVPVEAIPYRRMWEG
ncbi:MAG TPA: NUDIX domain-containing protein, partial [bacterium]|nr:NUDIX domain-containing protein [bacterium]